MSLERELDKASKNIRDAVDEVKHRTAADAERLDRETDPGTMTESERFRSALNETKHNIEADIDKGKRELRKNT
jgi:predicted  nucleic acid-binding Zn-ribbon protein